MEDRIRRTLQIKENELASLTERTQRKRSTLERELAMLDQQAEVERVELEREIAGLKFTANVVEKTLGMTQKRRVNRSDERKALFQQRSQVMRKLLEEANGKEIHAKQLSQALGRPISTVKDYYNEQPNLRPEACFWENGIDQSHYKWAEKHAPHSVKQKITEEIESSDYWFAT